MRAARTASILFTVALLAGGAAGCGGSKADYQEVPGAPVDVTIPSDPNSLGDAAAGATATPTVTPTPTPSAGATAPSGQSGSTGTSTGTGTAGTGTSTGTGTGGATTPTSGSGGATAPGTQDSPSADSPPPAGSDAQQFEDFCAQNPGAC